MERRSTLRLGAKHRECVHALTRAFVVLAVFVILGPVSGATAYTLTVTANHGAVTVAPDKAQYDAGEVVTLVPKPETGYCFSGWTGDAHGRSLLLDLTIETDTVVTANFGPWQPPIGIPMPEFGIFETHRMYEGQTFDFGSGPEPYRDAGNGPYTHYVDNTDPNATDTGNPYGTTSRPRRTVPENVAAGSVVEIHGGPYSYDSDDDPISFSGTGTPTHPIFIRGVDNPVFREPAGLLKLVITASYLIVEDIELDGIGTQFFLRESTSDHVVLRNTNHHSASRAAITTHAGDHLVLYNISVHDTGNWQVYDTDYDYHGVKVGGSNITIVDSEFYHLAGDGIQVGGGDGIPGEELTSEVESIFIGRNRAYENSQVNCGVKTARNVVFSQNHLRDCVGSDIQQGSTGGPFGYSLYTIFRANEIWFLFNTVYNTDEGIVDSATLGPVYAIGNVVCDSGSGIVGSGPDRHVYQNTIFKVTNPMVGTDTRANNLIAYPDGDGIDESFADADKRDLHLKPTSPAIDNADAAQECESILSHYESTFGESIRFDMDRNPRPQGSAWDIGAYEYTLAAVDDLSVSGSSQNSVTLHWTAPGEEGVTGTPTRYDIRYGTVTLSDANWDVATQVQGEPVPGECGQEQSFTVVGLSAGATYCFAIKTGDGAGHVSALSHVAPGVTASTGNHAPVFDPIGDRSVAGDHELRFTVSATDADSGDTLTYSATNVPAGGGFDPATRTFAWTPASGQGGTYHVTFEVSDGQVAVFETIAIVVDNRAPVLTAIGGRTVAEGTLLNFSVTATDLDGDTLTYSATGLPSGASFAGQTFNWTPGYSQEGSYSVTFSVSDGTLRDSEAITIAVGNVNRAPELATIGDRSVEEGTLLSFTISATDADGDPITYSATGLPAGATLTGQAFSWTPDDDQAGGHSVTFAASDGTADDSETILITVGEGQGGDETPPSVENLNPVAGAIQVPLNPLITLTVADVGLGVDANSVGIWLNDNRVYEGNSAVYKSDYGVCYRTGTPESYCYRYQPTDLFNCDQPVSVRVAASDLAHNVMDPRTYQFVTAMHGFGQNQLVSADYGSNDGPVVATDTQGDIWAAWHAGQAGAREILVARRDGQTQTWDAPVSVTGLSYDGCNPAIAVAPDDTLYVTWQDNRRGTWDIYTSVSADGATWQTPVRVTDSNDNQTDPDIVIDRASPPRAYIAWQDDGAGSQNRDIHLASSTTLFVSKTITQVTSHAADQTEPALAVGSDNTVHLVWTDQRNGSADIYGSASSASSWANVAFVTGAGNQQDPAVAVDPDGSLLHVLWVSDTGGDMDVVYGASEGLPDSPITGSILVDDSSGADQLAPSLLAVRDHWSHTHVYACWQDHRSVADAGDTDLYFAEIRAGTGGTNILVGDDGASSNQSDPALGFDQYGQPAILWTDDRDDTTQIYCACSTYFRPIAVASALIPSSTGGTVGTTPASIDDYRDVSVTVPPLGYDSDMLLSISEMQNPPNFAFPCLAGWEIGPSGTQFALPATITIPFVGSDSGRAATYWYDPQTGTLSQEGMTEILNTTLDNGLSVISLRTAHLTTFYILEGSGSIVDDGAAGGGCSLSTNGDDSPGDLLVLCLGLAVVMSALKLRDGWRPRAGGRVPE